MWLRAVTRTVATRAASSLHRGKLKYCRPTESVRFRLSPQERGFSDQNARLLAQEIQQASSFREAKKLFYLEVERCGSISAVDPPTLLAFYLRILDWTNYAHEFPHVSSGIQIALQKASMLNGTQLGHIFKLCNTPERILDAIPFVSTIVERLVSGDVINPGLSDPSVRFMLRALAQGARESNRPTKRPNVAAIAMASSTLEKLAEYCQHMLPHLAPDVEFATSRARGEVLLRSDPVDVLRQLFSGQTIDSATAVRLSQSALRLGKRTELLSLATSLSWTQHDPSLIISHVLSALVQARDTSGIEELLRLLPFELTMRQSIFVLFAPIIEQTRSSVVWDMFTQMFFRVWESFMRGGHSDPVLPQLSSALDALLGIAFKKQDANLARAVVEAASGFKVGLTPSSVNRLLFLYLDNGFVDESLTLLECAVDESKASELSSTARLFNIDSTLSSVDRRVFQHLAVTMTKFELWSFSTRFVQLLRKLNQKLSDSFCAASFVEASIAGADARRRLVLCQFFIDLPDLFVLTPRTINAFIQEAGIAGRPDVCLQFAQELFNRFGADQADTTTLKSILRGFTLSGDDSLVLRVMIMLRDSGVKFDASFYNVILKMYVSRRDPHSFFDVLRGMKSSGVEPTQSMYGGLLDLCIQTKSPVIVEALDLALSEKVKLSLARLRACKLVLRHGEPSARALELTALLTERIQAAKLEKTSEPDVPRV